MFLPHSVGPVPRPALAPPLKALVDGEIALVADVALSVASPLLPVDATSLPVLAAGSLISATVSDRLPLPLADTSPLVPAADSRSVARGSLLPRLHRLLATENTGPVLSGSAPSRFMVSNA